MQESSKIARPAGGAAKQAAVCDWGGQQSHTQYNTTHDERASVDDLLPTGAEYAISRRQLIQITGLADRKLRRKWRWVLSSQQYTGVAPMGCYDDCAR